MDEIVKMVADRTGMSESAARTAVVTVLGFLKDKLPAGIGDHLESFIDSDGSGKDSPLGDIGGMIGGLFGKK
ncbi:MAG: hypothetical protein ITG00_01115 [Flavobacterium sp.]|nr:hypothetical protein [Flavobacterium sp.]